MIVRGNTLVTGYFLTTHSHGQRLFPAVLQSFCVAERCPTERKLSGHLEEVSYEFGLGFHGRCQVVE